MILYYAMGGGLGHLVRAQAFLHTFRIASYRIYSSSPWAYYVFPPGKLIPVDPGLEKDPVAFLAFLVHTLGRNKYSKLVIDSFPAGILGEIGSADHLFQIPIWYITRRMKWNEYHVKVSTPVGIEKTIVLEELEEPHREFVERNSLLVMQEKLHYPEEPVPEELIGDWCDRPVWLIVHAGNTEEIMILLEHARDIARFERKDPQIYLISPNQAGEISVLNFFPAFILYPYADKIISGCGFNTMQQTGSFRDKHIFIPFPRKYDDQLWRSSEVRQGTYDLFPDSGKYDAC